MVKVDKQIAIKYIRQQINIIENRNKNYLQSKKWQKLKALESQLYSELDEGKEP